MYSDKSSKKKYVDSIPLEAALVDEGVFKKEFAREKSWHVRWKPEQNHYCLLG